MPVPRDPLSVAYDSAAVRVLNRAVRRHRAGGGYVRTFVVSPGRELRALDPGGHTRHERAFKRSLYYQVVQVPRRLRQPRVWSLRIEYGPWERRGGRWGRVWRLRLYLYGSGYRRIERTGGRYGSYVSDPALRAQPGHIPRTAA